MAEGLFSDKADGQANQGKDSSKVFQGMLHRVKFPNSFIG